MWHRRARKTTTAIHELLKQAHVRVGTYWHIFPTYSEAKDAVWRDPNMLFSIIPEVLIEKKNESELVVFFKNGSILQLKGADNPDRLRGANPVGVVLDEFATMKRDTWDVIIEPIIRANQGWCWFIGTPKGKNQLFEMYQRGLQGNPEWKSFLLKASESGIIAQEQLMEAKRTSIPATFNQEWECKFLEGEGSVFRNVRDVATALPKAPELNHLYVMGVDLAKVQDYTVIVVYDRTTNKQVYQDRFNKLEWPFQKSRIIEIAKHYNNALVMLDATGIGDPIADDLLRAGVAVEPFKITNESKKEMIEKLSIWIEQKRMAFINIQDTLYEFDNFSYEITSSGRILYGAIQGFHDDIIIATALAVWGLQPLIIQQVLSEQPLIRQEYYKRMQRGKEASYIDYEEID